MRVVISYENYENINSQDKKIIGFYSVCGSPDDEIELDTFSDVYELAQELNRAVSVGSFVIRGGKAIPHIIILNEDEEGLV